MPAPEYHEDGSLSRWSFVQAQCTKDNCTYVTIPGDNDTQVDGYLEIHQQLAHEGNNASH